MKKLFLCLANSKKYGERCVAGIELEVRAEGGFKSLRLDGKPKWIRPITDAEHGAVPEELVENMHLLGVYELEIIEAAPNAYQSENVRFKTDSFQYIKNIRAKNKNLHHLTEHEATCLFLNRGKAIPSEKIAEVHRSLVLIKAEQPEAYFHGMRLRIKFKYNSIDYDLPVTDTFFLEQYYANMQIVEQSEAVYITVSLGIEYEGWYYKLAAGIVCVNE